MSQVTDELSEIVEHCSGFANARFPGSVFQASVFGVTPNQQGFGFSPDGKGLALVMGDVTDVTSKQWSLQFTASVAVDVADVNAAANWVNQRNRNSAVGKYYYTLAADGSLCAVLWEYMLWSGLLIGLLADGPQGPRVQWLLHLLRECAYVTTQESAEFTSSVAHGRILSPQDGDTFLLFGAMSAG